MRLSNHYWRQALEAAGISVLAWRGEKDGLLIGNNYNRMYETRDPLSIIILQHTSVPGPLSQQFIKKARCTIAMSSESAVRLRRYQARGVKVFHPYVPATFKPGKSSKKHGRVYVGRISVNKGIKETLKYLSDIQEECHFYGDGDLVRAVQMHPYAKYCGVAKYEALPYIYNQYKTYTWRLPRYGGYGRTLIEAALCGLELDVNKENFGIFKEDGWDFSSPGDLRWNLDRDLNRFVRFIESQL